MSSDTSKMPWAEQEFGKARTQAILQAISSIFQRQPRTLLPLHAVRSRILVRGQHYLGLQSVRLDRIVGSEGRALEFDRHFLPRTGHTKARWMNIILASLQGRQLPPIEVYKLGAVYFIRDGNHRVSVARRQGQVEIDAYVTELATDVVVRPELTASNLVHLEEQSDFLEWTNLARVRCSITIEVSMLGGYLDLIGHINRHRTALSSERGYEVAPDEATAHWYDTVYLPVINRIRHSNVMQRERGMTEAELFLAVLAYGDRQCAQGVELTLTQAAEQYIAHVPRPTLLCRLWTRLRS